MKSCNDCIHRISIWQWKYTCSMVFTFPVMSCWLLSVVINAALPQAFFWVHSIDSKLALLALMPQTFVCVFNGNCSAQFQSSSRMEGVAHPSFKNNNSLPSFLLLITHFIKQMLHTLPLGLGAQKKKFSCHGHLSLQSLCHQVSEKW